MTVAKKRMTLEEFLALPEEKPALEFEDGVVTQKVSPNIWHSALQHGWAELINAQVRTRKLARALPELRTAWTGRSRVPDVSVYTWDRLPRDPAGRLAFARYMEPPDIVIEITSPGQIPNAMLRRLLSFLEAGVRAAILTDPDDESVLVVRPRGEPLVLLCGDNLDLSDIVSDLRIEVSALFDFLSD